MTEKHGPIEGHDCLHAEEELALLREKNTTIFENPETWMRWCDEKVLAENERLDRKCATMVNYLTTISKLSSRNSDGYECGLVSSVAVSYARKGLGMP